jgi:signal transduction histidine kinase
MSWMTSLPLKHRIALLSAALGLCLSVGFAAAAWWIAEDYEALMMGVLVEAEVERVRAQLAAGRTPVLPGSERLRGWHWRAGMPKPSGLPAAVFALQDGVHEDLPGLALGLHATIVTLGADRLFFLMDLDRVERLEHFLLGASLLVLVVGGAVSALAGQWLAGRALKPLARLAADIEALPPPPAVGPLSTPLHDPMLRQVGEALRIYQQRLAEAELARERFFADASHELRTPITSLRGAVEVLLDDADTAEPTRRRLARIDRAVEALSQLLDGLLLSARALPAAAAGCKLDSTLEEVVQRLRPRAAARRVALTLTEGASCAELSLPGAWLELLLLNLLRSLIDHAEVSSVRIKPGPAELRIEIEGPAPADEHACSDRGFGLRLAAALGERLQVPLTSDARGLHLDFRRVMQTAAVAEPGDNGKT